MSQDRLHIKASVWNGMVNIDSDDISYANIKGLYKKGDGFGLQLNNEEKRLKIEEACHLIAQHLYELETLLKQ